MALGSRELLTLIPGSVRGSDYDRLELVRRLTRQSHESSARDDPAGDDRLGAYSLSRGRPGSPRGVAT
jgi:hypothetical protein